jgi:hypothetical protein
MRRRSFRPSPIATALLVAISAVAIIVLPSFSIMTKATMADLTAGATGIVQGKVLSVAPRWDAEGKTIFTYVTVAVNQWLKGTGARAVTIRIPGGEVGDVGLWVEDTPVFFEGQDVVAFLEPSSEQSVMQVKGLFQGKFTIENGKVIEAGLPVGDFVRMVGALVKMQEKELNQK